MPKRSTLLLIVAACVVLGWFLAHPPGIGVSQETRDLLAHTRCPLPPRVVAGAAPLQTDAPKWLALPTLEGAKLTPLAGFSVEARVLGVENYWFDDGAKYAPTDLALGWGRMRDPAVLDQLSFSQDSRFFHYYWRSAPPIPPAEITRSASNMHIIPSTPDVAHALNDVEPGDNA